MSLEDSDEQKKVEPSQEEGKGDNPLQLDFQEPAVPRRKPMPLGAAIKKPEPIMEPTPLPPEEAAAAESGVKRPVPLKALHAQPVSVSPSVPGESRPKPIPLARPKAQAPVPAQPRVFSEKEHAEMKQQAKASAERAKPAKPAKAAQAFSARLDDGSTLGGMMQAARTRVGLSIPQVEGMTRIKKSYLEALETDNYEELPPPVFISAYIRTLSGLYNLSKEDLELVQEKLREVGTRSEVPETLIQNLEKDGQVNVAEERRVQRWLIGLGCAVILVALWGLGVYVAFKFKNARELATAEAAVVASQNAQPQTPAGGEQPSQQPAAAKPIAANSFNAALLERFIVTENPTMSELKVPGATTASAPQKRK